MTYPTGSDRTRLRFAAYLCVYVAGDDGVACCGKAAYPCVCGDVPRRAAMRAGARCISPLISVK